MRRKINICVQIGSYIETPTKRRTTVVYAIHNNNTYLRQHWNHSVQNTDSVASVAVYRFGVLVADLGKRSRAPLRVPDWPIALAFRCVAPSRANRSGHRTGLPARWPWVGDKTDDFYTINNYIYTEILQSKYILIIFVVSTIDVAKRKSDCSRTLLVNIFSEA